MYQYITPYVCVCMWECVFACVSVWACGWISIGTILNKDKYESERAAGILGFFFRGDVASEIGSFNDMSKQKSGGESTHTFFDLSGYQSHPPNS